MSKSCFHLKSNHVCTYEPDIWQCDRVNVTYDGAMTDAVVERYWNREREREINEYSGHIPQGRCSCPSIWNRCWAGGGRMPQARHVPEKSSVQMSLPELGWCQLPLTLSTILGSCEPSGNDGKNRPILLRSRSRHRHLHWYGQDIMLTGKNDIQHLISTSKGNTYGKCRAIFHPNLFKGIWRGEKLFILYKLLKSTTFATHFILFFVIE